MGGGAADRGVSSVADVCQVVVWHREAATGQSRVSGA
mgnify:CR=1 FL=1